MTADRAVPVIMVACWCVAVVLSIVFAEQIDYVIMHGWHPSPR